MGRQFLLGARPEGLGPLKPDPEGGLTPDSTCLMILLPWMEGGNAVAPAVRRGSHDVSSVL
jgi:hypothetical protein